MEVITERNKCSKDLTRKLLKEKIKKAGYKQKYVAEQIGVTELHLSNVLNGRDNLTPETVFNIMNFLMT